MAHILIIEDELHIRDNLARFLRLEGYQVVACSDGLAGVQAAREQAPQLILCDVMMPRMDGFEVLRALRQNPALSALPFVMLSASAEPERLEQALLLGASAYITKPFQLDHLRSVIKRLLLAQ